MSHTKRRSTYAHLTAARAAARLEQDRHLFARATIAALRDLGAPMAMIADESKTERARHIAYKSYIRIEYKLLLDDMYPRRPPKAKPLRPLRERFPLQYREHMRRVRKLKDKLVEGFITLDEYAEREQRLTAYYKEACQCVGDGLPVPSVPKA